LVIHQAFCFVITAASPSLRKWHQYQKSRCWGITEDESLPKIKIETLREKLNAKFLPKIKKIKL